MSVFLHDVRFAIRTLLKRPGFAAVIILTLALGIGANTAIFSVLNGVVLRPLQFEDPDELVMVWETSEETGLEREFVSYPNFTDWKEQNQVFDGVAVFRSTGVTLTGVDEPERIRGAQVSGDFFSLLRTEAAVGRTFRSEDHDVGTEAVVVLGDGLWRRRFGGDTDIIGQSLTLDGKVHTVIGVLPPDFRFPVALAEAELWTPLDLEFMFIENRGAHWLRGVGRLRPDVTVAQAAAEMDTIAGRLERQYPDSNTGRRVNIIPLHEQVVAHARLPLLMLLGAVGLVLLIACANVANLLLARSAGRRGELAIRTAVGAGRLRLVRQLLTESVVLGLAAGSVGVLLAMWGVDALAILVPADFPRTDEIDVDRSVFAFALILTLCTSMVFGLAPALHAAPSNLPASLKESGREAVIVGSRGRLRGALVVSEVALALVLLIGAGLLMRSFQRLMGVDFGFAPENVLTFELSLPPTANQSADEQAELYSQVLGRLESLPTVQSACANTTLPLTGGGIGLTFEIEGRPQPAPDTEPSALYGSISPSYFHTMGIPLIEGRPFNELDTRGRPGVMIINQAMAQRFWPGESPLGHRLSLHQGPFVTGDSNPDSYEIVGVVGDVRRFILEEPEPCMYVPLRQQTWSFMSFALRSTGNPTSLIRAVRGAVGAVTQEAAPYAFKTLDQYLADTVAQRRFAMLLLGIFAAVALILAAVGIYGTLSYTVAQRTHEIGLRMALGAQRTDLVGMVLKQGLALTASGLVIGLVGALAGTRVLASLLFQINALDPATFVGVPLLLGSVALLACYIPARRATKVDPMVALRCE
ncbi:MAG: ABC transporter permease [Phycisphaerales bacterium]|nr:MAG: ABC transporter permease [Phycisphaerales bacterium]